MKYTDFLKILFLLLSFHCYVFLSGLVYHYLEKDKLPQKSHVEAVLDTYFYEPLKASPNGPRSSKAFTPPDKKAVLKALESAVEYDEKSKTKSEFSSLWKAYLFSLTTIATVGNSGLYLQGLKSQLFFFFSTSIGTVLYVVLLHHMGLVIFEILIQFVQFEFRKNIEKSRWGIKRPSQASICVFLLALFFVLTTIVVSALALVVSGHAYTLALCAVLDSALTIGNFHMMAFLYPWTEAGFVVSIDVLLLVCHMFIYTTALALFHFVRGTKWEDLVEMYGGDERMYKSVSQEEERPFKQFYSQIQQQDRGGDDSESTLQDEVVKPGVQKGEVAGESVVPTLLSPEDEEFWDDSKNSSKPSVTQQ